MTTASDVIDWDEAMEQCGDDEEFLRELLDDLRGETDAQLAKIEEEIRAPTEAPFHKIMRASHVIKGAASNLMCSQLRTTAMNLEQAASAAHELGGSADAAVMENVKVRYMELKAAVENYHAFLTSIGV
jgi:HPt (histidine-containing phosphotransfer) domain-containing protein